MSSPSEPRNPLYLLLLVVGLIFVMTALAYALIPVIEQKAIARGELIPHSTFRDALLRDGWLWLLVQVVILIVLSIASMVLDRLRSLQKERDAHTISSTSDPDPPPEQLQR